MSPSATSSPQEEVARLRSMSPEYHNVICIGAGVTSLALVCQLQMKLGETDFVVLEREGGIGGTWYNNTYPGAGCDIPVPLYSFSFAQKRDWSSFFALHDEIRSYLEQVADRFDVTRKCRFQTEVVLAEWDDALGLWHVYTRPKPGAQSTLASAAQPEHKHFVSKFLFSGVGQLCVPNPCTIKGHESFQGPLFHSAKWDHSVQMANKNVFVIGNGCSATQFVPLVAKEAQSVRQAVRSKHWYAQRPHDLYDLSLFRWVIRNVPGVWRLQRVIISVVLEFHALMMYRDRFGTFLRNRFAQRCVDYAHKTAPKKYHDAIIPKPGELQPGCKRRVFDTDYLTALQRSNVDLVSSPVTEIRAKSVMTKDGKEHPADVIVLANGFATSDVGFPMKIVGRDGADLQEYWRSSGGPQTYRSCMMNSFPNFFLGMGTNAGTGHFSYIFTAECLTQFAIHVMEPILKTPRPYVFDPKSTMLQRSPSVVPKKEAEYEETVWIQSVSNEKMVYGFDCGSWYVDSESGRQTAMYPSFQFMYWLRSANPLYHRDFVWEGVKPPGGLFTRAREWLGIGGIPKPSAQALAKFKRGDYATAQRREKEQTTKKNMT